MCVPRVKKFKFVCIGEITIYVLHFTEKFTLPTRPPYVQFLAPPLMSLHFFENLYVTTLTTSPTVFKKPRMSSDHQSWLAQRACLRETNVHVNLEEYR
jgi:hypothetical protein